MQAELICLACNNHQKFEGETWAANRGAHCPRDRRSGFSRKPILKTKIAKEKSCDFARVSSYPCSLHLQALFVIGRQERVWPHSDLRAGTSCQWEREHRGWVRLKLSLNLILIHGVILSSWTLSNWYLLLSCQSPWTWGSLDHSWEFLPTVISQKHAGNQ